MVPALVLLDAAGNVLRPSIQQSDARAAAEVAELAAEVDEAAFLARTGNGVNQQLVATEAALARAPRAGRLRAHRDRVRLL